MIEVLEPFSNKKIKIYKTTIPFENKKEFVSQIRKGYGLSPHTIKPKNEEKLSQSPGWQYPISINSDVISDFRNRSLLTVREILNETLELFVRFDWVFEPTNGVPNGAYHTHTYNGFPRLREHIFEQMVPNQWTFTYYFQMPENDEGLLWFKYNDEEFSFKPNVEDLYLFPASLEHRYDGSPNSSINRFCYACNLLFIDMNKEYIKNKKTII